MTYACGDSVGCLRENIPGPVPVICVLVGDLMRVLILILAAVMLLFLPSGCNSSGESSYNRYTESIFDTFDTLVQVVIYAESEEEFREYFSALHDRLKELHRLYDIYNSYEGINNVKTINDNAGIRPVEVEQEIIDLINFSRQWSDKTGGNVNIALGPVLEIWHFYRQEALFDPENAQLPPMEDLLEANLYTDLDLVQVDEENRTVFLPEREMSLDVGAVAKGYALQLAVDELIQNGLESAIISAGGNIRTVGSPKDGERDLWGIGIRDPDASVMAGTEDILDVIYLESGSVDTSGDYQRYYIVDGEMAHHIIDPNTLMPANYYRAVTVVANGSGPADFMSTALFLLPYEESLALVESLEDFEALWVMPDGEVRTTVGMEQKLRSHGATNTRQ